MNDSWHFKILILLILLCSCAAAVAISLNQTGMARVCVVDGTVITATTQPDFLSANCHDLNIDQLDPQGRLLWVAVDLDVEMDTLHSMQPLGLFISGKTSAQVYFNGQILGNNGQPARMAENEVAGQIDAVIHLPIDLLQPVDNQLQLLLSAHHGFIRLAHPIHSISLGTYQRPTNGILRYYWPSLLPFGVLLLGFFYLTLMAWLNRMPRHVFLLPLMAVLAAAQLFVEVIRGIHAYSYPWHDLRLMAILLFSLGFGLSLLAYVLQTMPIKKRMIHWLVTAVVLMGVIWVIPGFDSKSLLAIMLSVAVAMAYSSRAWYLGQPQARFVLFLLLGFILMIFLSAYSFIDTVYYYFVALLIFLLMAQQAKQAALDKKLQLKYQARADQLQQIIEQKTMQDSTEKIEIRSAGKTEWQLIRDLAYCKGAGDYVELFDVNGDVKLFHGSITELSLRLPTTFLKTHRSYLVNTTLINSLERNPSGAGQLVLSQGAVVPVSKRILPQVREKLS